MLGLWAFRFVLWYILFLLTQPHYRFKVLIPLHLGDILMIGGSILHILQALSLKRPIIVFGVATRICIALLFISLATHYFNPNKVSTNWNVDIDGLVKVSIVGIILEAQVYTVYRAFAIPATLLLGTLWWLKGGVRLAQSGATWGSDDRLMGVHVSIVQNPNDFAYQLAFALAFHFLGYQLVTKRWQKLFFALCMGISSFIILETGSRTGLLALLTVGVAIAAQAWRRGGKKLVFGGVGVLVLLLMVFTSKGNIARFQTIFTLSEDYIGTAKRDPGHVETADEGSGRIRFVKNAAAWELICHHPLMGIGTNPNRQVFFRDISAAGKVHNEMLQAGKQMGFPGMAVYLFAVFAPFVLAKRTARLASEQWPGVAVFASTARIALLATMVGGFFSPSLFNFPHMMLMVSLVSLHRIVKNQLSELEGATLVTTVTGATPIPSYSQTSLRSSGVPA